MLYYYDPILQPKVAGQRTGCLAREAERLASRDPSTGHGRLQLRSPVDRSAFDISANAARSLLREDRPAYLPEMLPWVLLSNDHRSVNGIVSEPHLRGDV